VAWQRALPPFLLSWPTITIVTTSKLFLLVLLCVCAIGPGASAGVAGTLANATLTVTYIGTSSLQVRLGDGTTVRSGASIPAGSYQVIVDDADYTNPKFTMNGPGVNISSDLNSSGMGIDRPAFFGPYTLATSSTYTLQDANMGASTAITFTTSATSSASGASNSSGSSSVSGGSSGSTSSGGTSSSASSSTSSTMKMVGTLKASVNASGKPTLTFNGKAVKALKTGRYMVTVEDHSKKAGLIVWQLGRHAMTLSGSAALGSSSHVVTFSTGKWFFEASMAGPRTYFSVTT
jgi:hypothetical protein